MGGDGRSREIVRIRMAFSSSTMRFLTLPRSFLSRRDPVFNFNAKSSVDTRNTLFFRSAYVAHEITANQVHAF